MTQLHGQGAQANFAPTDGASSVITAFTPEQAAVVSDTVGVDVLVSLKE
jgi:hypothetical protein